MAVETAFQKIMSGITPLKTTDAVDLVHCDRRILAQDIRSGFNIPAYDNSAMDGFACRISDINAGKTALKEIGASFAGHPFVGEVGDGECVRITTGAVVPDGADVVVMREQTSEQDGIITFPAEVKLGQNIRKCGEDIAVGDTVISAGRTLNSADIALLATLGIGSVSVQKKLTVALFSTGDELREPGQELPSGCIYDCNRPMLKATLLAAGYDVLDLGIIKDDKAALKAAFDRAQKEADAIVTSGGVSVGDADYTTEILREGGQIGFWKLAIKPGKPFAFGHFGTTPFFGLPGNPVSALITCQILALPAMNKLSGSDVREPKWVAAEAAQRFKKRPGRTDYQRGIMYADSTGKWLVASAGAQVSSSLMGLAKANCLLRIEQERGDVAEGEEVAILPFENLPGL